MKKAMILLAAVIMMVGIASGQVITFEKTFGGINSDAGFSVQQTTDGGYIIVGTTNNFGAGNTDFYSIKTDANGNSLWIKTFGGTSADAGKSIQQTTDGGYIIVGYTASFGSGNNDFYLIRTDTNGNSLWTKTFGGLYDDLGVFVRETTDGGYIITGYTATFGSGSTDVYLIKTNTNGNFLWKKTFGGTNPDVGSSVQQTMDGGYIITGKTQSFGTGDWDVYLIRTDANGNSLWTKTFGGTNIDEGYSVEQTEDGGYVIVGVTKSFGAGWYDIYLIKTDVNGDSLWTKTLGGMYDDLGYSIHQTNDGGYIIAGKTGSFGAGNLDVFLIKADANGNSLWIRTFGGTKADHGYYIQQTEDGGYIISGATWSLGMGSDDVYLIKTDSLGNVYPTGITSTINNQQSTINISPNPFTQTFTINYSLSENCTVSLKLFDVTGKLISEVLNQKQSQGEHTFNYNGKQLPEGMYYFQLITNNGIETRKIVKQ